MMRLLVPLMMLLLLLVGIRLALSLFIKFIQLASFDFLLPLYVEKEKVLDSSHVLTRFEWLRHLLPSLESSLITAFFTATHDDDDEEEQN
jgi:hypothetical protein